MPQIIPMILTLIILSGCGLPWYYTAGKAGLDAILWTNTGKTSTDHIASDIINEDCKMFRIFDGDKMCMNEEEHLDFLIAKDCEIYTFDRHEEASCVTFDPTTWDKKEGILSDTL
jgi:hypothetical protein